MQREKAKWNERIRILREHRKISQGKIAGLLQISQRTYSDYESGRLRIPVTKLIFLARYYDCSMDYISGVSNVHKPFPLF